MSNVARFNGTAIFLTLPYQFQKYRDPNTLEGPQPCLGAGDDNLFDTTQIQEMIEIYQESGRDVIDDDDDVANDDQETANPTSHRRAKRSSKLIRDFKINRWDMPIKYKIDGYLGSESFLGSLIVRYVVPVACLGCCFFCFVFSRLQSYEHPHSPSIVLRFGN